MSFALLVVVLVIALIAWLGYALIRAPRLNRPLSVVAGVCLAVTLVVSVSWLVTGRFVKAMDAWRGYTAIAASLLPVILYTLIGTLGIGLINLIWSAGQAIAKAPKLEPDQLRRTRRLRFVRVATVAVLIGSLGVTGYGYHETRNVQISQTSVTSSLLPAAFDGFRIALLSDIHAGPGLGRDFVQGLVDQVNAEHPDLIVIAGDLSDGTPEQTGGDLLPLTTLSAPYGVLVTTGNHEFVQGAQAWLDWLNQHGLVVLDNSGTILIKGDASIDVLGVNDRVGTPPHAPDLQEAADRLHANFGVPTDGAGRFRILIAHEPLQVYSQGDLASKLGVDLQLSGHTHGGQLWPIGYVVTMQQPVLDGTHVLDGITVVTSRGAGSWGPPERVGAPPEIPIITLHRA